MPADAKGTEEFLEEVARVEEELQQADVLLQYQTSVLRSKHMSQKKNYRTAIDEKNAEEEYEEITIFRVRVKQND